MNNKVKNETAELEVIELSAHPSADNLQSLDLEGGDDTKPLNDGSAPSNAAKEEMDDTTKMLMQMPPDWDLAERHGASCCVVDRAAILVAEGKGGDNKCKCCQQVVPEADQLYPLCGDNIDMGEMGAGYPLFFEFLRYCCYLLLLLFVVYFLPTAAILAGEYQDILDKNGGKLQNDQDPLALFSLGAVLNEDVFKRAAQGDFTEFKDKKGALFYLFMCSCFALVVTLFFLIYMRAKLIGKALLLDQDAFTPSDFCIQGTDMQFDDYTFSGMEKEIREHLEKAYGVTEVQYINPAFKIAGLYKLMTKHEELEKQEAIVRAYMHEKYLYVDTDYDKAVDEGTDEELPKWKDGSCSSEYVIDLRTIKSIKKSIQGSITEYEQRAESSKTDQQEQKDEFVGIVFIVLKKPADMLKIVKDSKDGNFMAVVKFFFGCCFDKSSLWKFERAPEPTDIYWENLHVSNWSRYCRASLSYLVSFLLILIIFMGINGLKEAQIEYKANFKVNLQELKKEFDISDEDAAKYGKYILGAYSGFISGLVFILNKSLKTVVRALSEFEQWETQTKIAISICFKLTILRFFNSTLVLIWINRNNTDEWFNAGGLVYEANVLLGINMVAAPMLTLFEPAIVIAKLKKFYQKMQGENCKMTQREANQLCEGHQFDIADKLSEYLVHIMASLFFSPIIPHAIVYGLVGTFLAYWGAKISLLRFAKMPEMFSEIIISFFANFLPYIVFIWSLAFIYYPVKLAYTTEDWAVEQNIKVEMIDESLAAFPVAAVIVVFFWMFMPIRMCINCVIGEQAELEPQYNKKYEEVYHQFASYYDKENPITQKKGQLRILDMQIKEAEAKGGDNSKLLAELRGQQTTVQSVNMFQQMQSYTVQNQARHQAFAPAFGGGGGMMNNPHNMMVQQQMMVAQQQRMVMQQQSLMMQQRTQALGSPHFQNRMMAATTSSSTTTSTQSSSTSATVHPGGGGMVQTQQQSSSHTTSTSMSTTTGMAMGAPQPMMAPMGQPPMMQQPAQFGNPMMMQNPMIAQQQAMANAQMQQMKMQQQRMMYPGMGAMQQPGMPMMMQHPGMMRM